MSKKMKVLVSVLVVVVLLTVGGAVTVMAQDTEKPTPTPEPTVRGRLAPGVGPRIELGKFRGYGGGNMTAVLAKVVEILNQEDVCPDLTVDDLEAAFDQARQEMRKDAFIRFLDKALAEGRISDVEYYDDIIEWWEARPEVLGLGLFGCGLGGPPGLRGAPGLHGRHKGGGPPGLFGGGHRGPGGPRLPKPGNGNGQ